MRLTSDRYGPMDKAFHVNPKMISVASDSDKSVTVEGYGKLLLSEESYRTVVHYLDVYMDGRNR
jgi:hypothetical protein